MNKRVISIDWFQYWAKNVRRTRLVMHTEFSGTHNPTTGSKINYRIIEGMEKHPLFRDSFTITNHGAAMVHVFMTPKMSSQRNDAVSVKVANRLLYKADWAWYLHDICDALGFEVLSITRADICIDFQRFDYRDLLPNQFIHAYLQDQRDNGLPTYIRKGRNVFCAYGNKALKPVFAKSVVNGKTECMVKSYFDYIRWGTRESNVCTYLYNKSQELRDKKSKPWIKERWAQVGLDEKKGDVYRVEFSIKAQGMQVAHLEEDEVTHKLSVAEINKLTIDNYGLQAALEDVFWSYFDKYFTFHKVGNQHYRKDMPKVQLFERHTEPTLLPLHINTQVNAGIAEKNAAKCLERVMLTCLSLTTDQQQSLYKASQVLYNVGVNLRNLKTEKVRDPFNFEELYKIAELTPYQSRILKDYLTKQISEVLEYSSEANVQRAIDTEDATRSMLLEDLTYWHQFEDHTRDLNKNGYFDCPFY